MNAQIPMPTHILENTKKAAWEIIRDYMLQHGQWRTPYEIRDYLIGIGFHTNLSDAGITARLRDLRKPKYGSYDVPQPRIRKGTLSREYVVRERVE